VRQRDLGLPIHAPRVRTIERLGGHIRGKEGEPIDTRRPRGLHRLSQAGVIRTLHNRARDDAWPVAVVAQQAKPMRDAIEPAWHSSNPVVHSSRPVD
jgi:hypothetical protein